MRVIKIILRWIQITVAKVLVKMGDNVALYRYTEDGKYRFILVTCTGKYFSSGAIKVNGEVINGVFNVDIRPPEKKEKEPNVL